MRACFVRVAHISYHDTHAIALDNRKNIFKSPRPPSLPLSRSHHIQLHTFAHTRMCVRSRVQQNALTNIALKRTDPFAHWHAPSHVLCFAQVAHISYHDTHAIAVNNRKKHIQNSKSRAIHTFAATHSLAPTFSCTLLLTPHMRAFTCATKCIHEHCIEAYIPMCAHFATPGHSHYSFARFHCACAITPMRSSAFKRIP